MDRKIRTAIVGFGVAGKFMHAPFLKSLSQYEVVAVLERNNNESISLFPDAKIIRSFSALLLMDDVELIVITTPNNTHVPYAKLALEKGKHVVLEKPFTINSQDAIQLIEISKKTNKILSVFQNRRYVSDFLTIKEILSKKLLGEVHEFEAHYYRYRPQAKLNAWRELPKPGSGILYDLGPHLIDQALCLFGLPKAITADIRQQRPHAMVDDYFDIRLDYGFLKVILKSGMLVREPGPRYLIHGTKGSFLKLGEDPQEALLRNKTLPTEIENWGMEKEEIFGILHTEINGEVYRKKYPSLPGDYGLYYKNLYRTIREQMVLREKPEHGYNTIRIVELALESNKRKATIDCEGLISIEYPMD